MVYHVSFLMLRENLRWLFEHMSYQGSVRVCLYPRGELACARGDNIFKADKISSLENGNFRRPGKGLSCFEWMKWHLCRTGSNGASVLSQKDAVPWGPTGPQGRASGCPSGLGAGGASSRSFDWRCNLCCQGPACISIPPSRPSEMTHQRGSRRVSLADPT